MSSLLCRHRSSAPAQGSRSLATTAGYAFNPIAKAPTKKFPLAASPKVYAQSTLGANGLQLVSVDDKQTPISSLSLVLNAGTRFHEGPAQQGVAQWIKAFGFKATNNRSAIRITREAEIMGHTLSTALTRENIFFQVDFRRDDLPDVVELLADLFDGYVRRDSQPSGIYTREFVRKTHDWSEASHLAQTESDLAHATSPETIVLDNLYRVAFRRGLGNPLYPCTSEVELGQVFNFIENNVIPSKTSLVGYGVDAKDFEACAKHFFSGAKGAVASAGTPSKYVGGEHFEEMVKSEQSVYAVAFPGASLAKADYFTAKVLLHLLGNNESSPVKYGSSTALFAGIAAPSAVSLSAFSHSYSDAGLFGVSAKGLDSQAVGESIKKSLVALAQVASGKFGEAGLTPAIEAAKLSVADELENASRFEKLKGLTNQLQATKKVVKVADVAAQLSSVTDAKVSAFAAKLLKSKPSVSAVGDVYGLPYIDQLGL